VGRAVRIAEKVFLKKNSESGGEGKLPVSGCPGYRETRLRALKPKNLSFSNSSGRLSPAIRHWSRIVSFAIVTIFTDADNGWRPTEIKLHPFRPSDFSSDPCFDGHRNPLKMRIGCIGGVAGVPPAPGSETRLI